MEDGRRRCDMSPSVPSKRSLRNAPSCMLVNARTPLGFDPSAMNLARIDRLGRCFEKGVGGADGTVVRLASLPKCHHHHCHWWLELLHPAMLLPVYSCFFGSLGRSQQKKPFEGSSTPRGRNNVAQGRSKMWHIEVRIFRFRYSVSVSAATERRRRPSYIYIYAFRL